MDETPKRPKWTGLRIFALILAALLLWVVGCDLHFAITNGWPGPRP